MNYLHGLHLLISILLNNLKIIMISKSGGSTREVRVICKDISGDIFGMQY